MTEKILICGHSGTIETVEGKEIRHPNIPLVFTFAWDGAERWCPWCGRLFDIFGGRPYPATDEMQRVNDHIQGEVKPYLENVYARRQDPGIKAVEWPRYQDFYSPEILEAPDAR